MAFQIKNTYYQNILKLLGGSLVSQVIIIAATPIVARTYSDNEFGIQGILFSVYSVICFLVTLKLENTLLTDNEFSQKQIIGLLSRLLILISIITIFPVIIFQDEISGILNIHSDSYYFLYLLPILLIINQLYEFLIITLNKNQSYNKIISTKISYSLSSNLGQIICGIAGSNALGLIIPQLASKTVLIVKSKLLKNVSLKKQKFQRVFFEKNINYIKYETPSSVINSFNSQGPLLLISNLYSISLGGQYFMSQRLLQLPITFFSHSVLESFRERISNSKTLEESRKIFLNTIKVVFITIIIPFIILSIYIEPLISYVLGDGWEDVSKISLYLLPSLFLRFFSYPLSFVLLLKKKQIVNLYCNILVFGSLLFLFFTKPEFNRLLIYISIIQGVRSLVIVYFSYNSLKDTT